MARKHSTPLALPDDLITALLEGRLKQIARALNERDLAFWQDEDDDGWPIYEDDFGDWFRAPAPYGPRGSHLWVRESYRLTEDEKVEYRHQVDPNRETPNDDWLPVVGMPEAASRIRLKIVKYRFVPGVQNLKSRDLRDLGFEGDGLPELREAFKAYWNRRYRKSFQKYDQNPAIWVARLKVIS